MSGKKIHDKVQLSKEYREFNGEGDAMETMDAVSEDIAFGEKDYKPRPKLESAQGQTECISLETLAADHRTRSSAGSVSSEDASPDERGNREMGQTELSPEQEAAQQMAGGMSRETLDFFEQLRIGMVPRTNTPQKS